MFKLKEKYQLFIGTFRYFTDNNILNSTGNFYKYKMLKVNNLNNNGLIDDSNQSLFFNSYFQKNIDKKYYLKKGDILVKLIKPIEFYLVTKDLDWIFNKSYCVIRSNKKTYDDALNLWAYLKMNEKNISKKFLQKQSVSTISVINLSTVKEIEINEKSFNKNLINLFYKKSELANLLIKKQLLLDKLFAYYKDKNEEL